MRKMYVFLLSMILFSGFSLIADPAAYVPVCADGAVYLNAARLKQIPALARLANSGEISRLERPLTELLIKPESFVAVFIGLDERLVLSDAPSSQELYRKLQKAYAEKKNFQIKSHIIEGKSAVTKIFYRPPSLPYHSLFEAVWVADHAAAFGNHDYPLPYQKLGPADEKYRELSAPGILAAALIPEPSRFGFDVMGLAQQMRNIRLTAREIGSGIELAGSAETQNAQFLKQTAQMFSGAVRILLVSFFGDNETLCQSLIQKIQISTESGRIVFRAELDAQTLQKIQNYYDSHTAHFQKALKNNMKKKK